MGPTYSQNTRSLEEYYGLLDEDVLPVFRGIELTADDLARRTVMNALMCHLEVAFESVEIAHLLDFKSYFANELEDLKAFADAGLVTIDDGWLCVTDRGRYVVWTICQVFNRYLRQDRKRASTEKLLYCRVNGYEVKLWGRAYELATDHPAITPVTAHARLRRASLNRLSNPVGIACLIQLRDCVATDQEGAGSFC
jgi:hypothetical protein